MHYGSFIFMFLGSMIYIVLIGLVLYLIYRWVSKFIALRQEQNDLLREIIRKMDNK